MIIAKSPRQDMRPPRILHPIGHPLGVPQEPPAIPAIKQTPPACPNSPAQRCPAGITVPAPGGYPPRSSPGKRTSGGGNDNGGRPSHHKNEPPFARGLGHSPKVTPRLVDWLQVNVDGVLSRFDLFVQRGGRNPLCQHRLRPPVGVVIRRQRGAGLVIEKGASMELSTVQKFGLKDLDTFRTAPAGPNKAAQNG